MLIQTFHYWIMGLWMAVILPYFSLYFQCITHFFSVYWYLVYISRVWNRELRVSLFIHWNSLYILQMFSLDVSFVLGVSCCTENVNIHDDKSANIFHDGLCFIFHLGRLFLYENCEHVFLYFLSILLLFLFFSLLKNSTLENFIIITV